MGMTHEKCAGHLLRPVTAAIFAMVICSNVTTLAQGRPRVIVLTDFFKDPDDKQSMIRFLCSANEFEVEGLLATSLAYGDGSVRPEKLHQLIDDYAKVLPNLRRHQREGYPFPSAESLARIIKAGAPVLRKFVGKNKGFPVPYPVGGHDSRSCEPAAKWVGTGKDSAAAEHIIQVVDRDDPRPVWIVVWGGAMDLAQALWKVRDQRSPAASRRFVSKLRVYQISWQDTGAVWIWNEFPELFLIVSTAANRGIYAEGSAALRSAAWVDANVRHSHGALGAGYPAANIPGIKEGDTSSFLHLLPTGLSDPEHPQWGGWGGRFRRLDPNRNHFVDARDTHPSSPAAAHQSQWTVGRWNDAISRDFAARMDWCAGGNFAMANHAPVPVLCGDRSLRVLPLTARPGDVITLSSAGSTDPDSHDLNAEWLIYREAGSNAEGATLSDKTGESVRLSIPPGQASAEIHVILCLHDSGTPSLTRYRRAVVTVKP